MRYGVVADTSPPQYLHLLGLLALLPQLFGDVLVPGAVVRELDAGRTAGQQLPDPAVFDWAKVAEPKALPPSTSLGAGEAAAIALAVECNVGMVLLDDYEAREAAAVLGLHVIGVLGVLLAAKKQGLLGGVRPHLTMLRNTGFYMSDDLERKVCRLAGEAVT